MVGLRETKGMTPKLRQSDHTKKTNKKITQKLQKRYWHR